MKAMPNDHMSCDTCLTTSAPWLQGPGRALLQLLHWRGGAILPQIVIHFRFLPTAFAMSLSNVSMHSVVSGAACLQKQQEVCC